MPNGKSMLNDMDFEQRLGEMGDNQLALLKFVARQQFEMSKLCPLHDRRLGKLESRNRKEIGATGGISALIGGVIVTIADYFLRR